MDSQRTTPATSPGSSTAVQPTTSITTMDQTQSNDNDTTDDVLEQVRSPVFLKITYNRPRFFGVSYRLLANVLGTILLLSLIGESNFLTAWTKFSASQFQSFVDTFTKGFENIDLLHFLEFMILLAIIGSLIHPCLLFLKNMVCTAALSVSFSFLVCACLFISENITSPAIENSGNPELWPVILLSIFNFAFSLIVLFVSVVGLYIEHKASGYAIAY